MVPRENLARVVIGCVALLLLAACSSPKPPPPQVSVQPILFQDPDDSVLQSSIQNYLSQNHLPAFSQYEFVRADLDGDGRRDGIVMFENPFRSWCNINGCEMIVFKALNDRFVEMSQIAPVRGPLTISQTRTNGWRDLVIRVSGRMDMQTKNVAMKFNGRAYPVSPEMEPPLPDQYAMNMVGGTRIFP